MGGSGHGAGCGINEIIVFVLALVAGTGCSLTSKVLLDMESVGMDGEMKKFEKPLFQTLGMFVGMCAALFLHAGVVMFKIPFPGYVHKTSRNGYSAVGDVDDDEEEEQKPVPIWMYFLLLIPSLFDLAATALCMMGLMEVEVSIYQMLRGSAIIFVAILKHFALGDKLRGFMWVGVWWNVVSIILVGATVILSATPDDGEGGKQKDPLRGVLLILAGAFVQSLQYAFEEKVMSMEVSAPPLLLIGMEGFWGTVVCAFVLYPVCYNLPGADVGGVMENPYDTWAMMENSKDLQVMFLWYFLSIFFYNALAVLVTFMLNSVWHAILDNFRPITVWGTDLFIFYFVTKSFGEEWTKWSFVQLAGLFVLLYGTAVYNAPHAGSIKLDGGVLSCFCKFDYSDMEDEDEEKQVLVPIDDAAAAPYQSPYQSPFMTPNTRAKRDKERRAAEKQGKQFTKVSRGGSFA
ncbi:hypothetical protein TrST_g2950 [Triparma strigata]|uniref:Drug/Metabolite Transporter (DMT) Superfamily n=1 Tax=Triparma strigata TaxID=1606541 RepID=A0A9W7EKP0_9STRA|nr:hypothetical protein TrST_g2950 [Triparma strigata]